MFEGRVTMHTVALIFWMLEIFCVRSGDSITVKVYLSPKHIFYIPGGPKKTEQSIF